MRETILYNYLEETIRTYNILARMYRRKPWSIIKYINEYINTDDKVYIADIGCGKGQYIEYILSHTRYPKAIAIDLAENMVKEFYKNTKYKHRVLPIVASAEKLPIASNKLYLELYIAVLHHILLKKMREQALREAYRCLMKGGVLVLTVWALNQIPFIKNIAKYYLFKLVNIIGIRKDALIAKIYCKGKRNKRYYYLFTFNEIIQEIKFSGFVIAYKKAVYERGKIFSPTKNYLIIATKK